MQQVGLKNGPPLRPFFFYFLKVVSVLDIEFKNFLPNNRSYSRVENCCHPLEEGANLDSRDQWRYYAPIWKRREMHCQIILKRSPHHPRGYCLTAADFMCSTRVEKRPTIEIELILIMFCSFLFQRQVWFQIRFMIFMIAHLDGFI
jgi:hypothetical protein